MRARVCVCRCNPARIKIASFVAEVDRDSVPTVGQWAALHTHDFRPSIHHPGQLASCSQIPRNSWPGWVCSPRPGWLRWQDLPFRPRDWCSAHTTCPGTHIMITADPQAQLDLGVKSNTSSVVAATSDPPKACLMCWLWCLPRVCTCQNCCMYCLIA